MHKNEEIKRNTWKIALFRFVSGDPLPKIFASLVINRLATVSTGWNKISSRTPDAPDPANRAAAELSWCLPPAAGLIYCSLYGNKIAECLYYFFDQISWNKRSEEANRKSEEMSTCMFVVKV